MHRTVATRALFTAGIIVGLASSEWPRSTRTDIHDQASHPDGP